MAASPTSNFSLQRKATPTLLKDAGAPITQVLLSAFVKGLSSRPTWSSWSGDRFSGLIKYLHFNIPPFPIPCDPFFNTTPRKLKNRLVYYRSLSCPSQEVIPTDRDNRISHRCPFWSTDEVPQVKNDFLSSLLFISLPQWSTSTHTSPGCCQYLLSRFYNSFSA